MARAVPSGEWPQRKGCELRQRFTKCLIVVLTLTLLPSSAVPDSEFRIRANYNLEFTDAISRRDEREWFFPSWP